MKRTPVLLRNARVFDGQHEKLAEDMDVLVEGNKIGKIARSVPAPAGATVVDAKGRVLMPGLTDVHWHSMFNFWPVSQVLASDLGYLSIAAAKAARETLLRGFTTVRDVGGNCFAVSKATDEGLIDGPRVYRLRRLHQPERGARRLPRTERGPDERRRAARLLLACRARADRRWRTPGDQANPGGPAHGRHADQGHGRRWSDLAL